MKSRKTIYRITRSSDGGILCCVTPDSALPSYYLDSEDTRWRRREAPLGFDPAGGTLALAILLDFTGDRAIAAVHLEDFREDFRKELFSEWTGREKIVRGENIAAFLLLWPISPKAEV